MVKLAAYLGVGTLCHLIFVGAHFDFSSAWTWLWLLGWPIMLFFFGSVAAIIVGLGVLAGYGAASLWGRI